MSPELETDPFLLGEVPEGTTLYPFAKEMEIRKQLIAGNRATTLHCIDEFFADLLARGSSLEAIRSTALQLLVVLGRKCLQIGTPVDHVLANSLRMARALEACSQAQEIRDFVKQVAQELLRCLAEQRTKNRHRAISTARKFIKDNYHKALTLEDMARLVHLSPWYFSRLFSQSTGFTFQQYLIHVRMEAAKELLAHRNLSVQSVSRQVGYEDVAYFIRLFKRHTGTTPRRYAEQLGLAEAEADGPAAASGE